MSEAKIPREVLAALVEQDRRERVARATEEIRQVLEREGVEITGVSWTREGGPAIMLAAKPGQ